MAWYTITIKVPKGEGDYGSDSKCLHDGPYPSRKEILIVAKRYAQLWKTEVTVFKGKRLGKLFTLVKFERRAT